VPQARILAWTHITLCVDITLWVGIDMVIQSEPAAWWQVVAAFAPLVAALALVFGLLVWCRLTTAPTAGSRRCAVWWIRAEGATNMALNDNTGRRKAGLALLEQLRTDRSVGKEDAHLIAQVGPWWHAPVRQSPGPLKAPKRTAQC
jgi:hypothetical protein